jgi:hypothetical protein
MTYLDLSALCTCRSLHTWLLAGADNGGLGLTRKVESEERIFVLLLSSNLLWYQDSTGHSRHHKTAVQSQ